MITNIDKEKDFFISYTGKDDKWAEWIAETLENNGCSTIIQAWDFKVGGSFVNDMNEAIKMCKKVILVLSENYLKSDYCTAEWQNFFVDDPIGKDALIIPIRIDDVKPEGLLKARTYIDLCGITDAAEAAKLLLEKVVNGSNKRKSRGFPGAVISFPGGLPFNNLPNRNIYFTGREKLLESIESAFKQKKGAFLTQAISGLGGIGKTQIAIEYAYRYAGQYNCIWLINAESKETLFSDLLKFADNRCGVDLEEATPDSVIAAVSTWTAGNNGWLFIFDNAEDYSTIAKYLPKNNAGQGNVLITSRNEFWDKTGSKAFKVDIYSEGETVQFLHNRTGIENDDENAKAMNKILGGLPLALEHAAAYISENDITFDKYIKMFNKYKIRLLEQGLTKDEASIASTWQASIDKIGIEAARQLLYICSYYAPEKIQLDTFILDNEYLMHPLKKVVADELELNSIIHELRRYSLISKEDRNLSIHRLLQESVRHNAKHCTEYIEGCFKHINKLMKGNNYVIKEGRDTARLLLPHALSVFNNIESLDLQLDDFNIFCFNMAYSYSEFAMYTDSVQFYNKALAISEKVLGAEHPATATTCNNIAFVYDSQGDYAKALEWYNKALSIREKALGAKHPDTATTYNNIAGVYDSQRDYLKALEWYNKALAISEKVLGAEHPDTATTYNNIALVYSRQGDYPKALEWYNKALSIREKVLGAEHPATATTYNNIAGVYDSQGDYLKALEWYNKALAISENVLGVEHPDTATTYNNIALVHSRQGDYAKALVWYNKALAISEKVLGAEHPDTATTYNNIALVYSRQGDYPKALEWYNRALSIREKVLEAEHPDTATTYNNIALVYDSQGDYPKALEWYNKALAIREKVLGAEHPSKATTYNNIAGVYDSQGDYLKALDWYNKALAISEKVLGAEHPATATTYNNIAFVYSRQGYYHKALELYNKALAISEKVLGAEHPDTATTYNNIALVYSRQGDYPKALEWYQKALTIYEFKLGAEHPYTQIVKKNIQTLRQ